MSEMIICGAPVLTHNPRPTPCLFSPRHHRRQIIPLFCMNAKKAAGVAETHAAKAFKKKTGYQPVDKDFARNLVREHVRWGGYLSVKMMARPCLSAASGIRKARFAGRADDGTPLGVPSAPLRFPGTRRRRRFPGNWTP